MHERITAVYADEEGNILDAPGMQGMGRTGRENILLKPEDLIPLPESADLMLLPQHQAVGQTAEGEVLPVATRSFGSIGVFAIPEMGRFYRHWLIEKNFPHHGAVMFGHYGKALFDALKYIGVKPEEIGYNHPAGDRYSTENPFS